jgi:hypothetical protein
MGCIKIIVSPRDNMEDENVVEASTHGDVTDSGSVHECSETISE